jgi:uncharacterized membrane protein
MRQLFEEIFRDYSRAIVFLHVLSAIVWIGGMIALRFVVHPALGHIDDVKVRMARSLEIKKRFFNLVIPFIVLLLLTSLFMIIGLNFRAGDPTINTFVHIKEAIWAIMTIVFVVIYLKRNAAERHFISGDSIQAKESVMLIDNYLIPLNIFLGVIALLFGVILRGY